MREKVAAAFLGFSACAALLCVLAALVFRKTDLPAPPPQPPLGIVSAAGPSIAAPSVAPVLPIAPACDARAVPAALLRDRRPVSECVELAMLALESINGAGSVGPLGWSAEESTDGPACWASYGYTLHGARRTMRFAFFPGAPARIATADDESTTLGDLCDGVSVPNAAVTPTEMQQGFALMFRLMGRRFAAEAYVDPREPATITIRRPHCVPGNVDLSGDQNVLRLFRRAGLRRIQCVGDAHWVQTIPPRGAVAPPELVTP